MKSILMSVLMACLLIPQNAMADEINLQAVIYPPLAYEQKGELRGVALDVVRKIQAIVGDTNPIKATPWLRAYKQSTEAPRQALFAIVRIPERENLFKWVGPVYGEGDYFFKRKGAPIVVKTLEDAKSVTRIAVRKDGYTHQTLVAKGFKNLDVGPSYDSSYKKLEEGRVDLVLMGERTYAYMVSQAGIDPDLFERTDCKLADSTAWLAFSRDIPDETITQWQSALDTIKSTGEYDKIMARNFTR